MKRIATYIHFDNASGKATSLVFCCFLLLLSLLGAKGYAQICTSETPTVIADRSTSVCQENNVSLYADAADVTDLSYGDTWSSVISYEHWQSFTPTIAGFTTGMKLNLSTSVEIYGIFSIYEGEGINGSLVYSRPVTIPALTHTYYNVSLPNLNLTVGNTYTYRWNGQFVGFNCDLNATHGSYYNPYFGLNPNFRINFKTTVSPFLGDLQWYNSGDIIPGATGTTYVATATGLYTCVNTEAGGCQSATSTPVSITIGSKTTVPVIVPNGPTRLCGGGVQEVVLNVATSITDLSYRGFSGASSQAEEHRQSFVPNISGAITGIELQMNFGHTATGTFSIYEGEGVAGELLYSRPLTIIGSWHNWVNVSLPNLNMIAGNTYTFRWLGDGISLYSNQNTPVFSYYNNVAGSSAVEQLNFITSIAAVIGPLQWYRNGNIIPGATGMSYTANITGSYQCVNTAYASGCQNGTSAAIVVNNFFSFITIQQPTIYISGDPFDFCAGSNMTLVTDEANSYLWSTGETTQSISVPPSGNYTVQVTNYIGCRSAPSTPVVAPQPLWYLDADGDGFYSETGNATNSCTQPGAGYSTTALAGDCDDSNNTAYPEATEICWNGIRENCSRAVSGGCAPIIVNMTPSYHNTTLLSLATAVPAIPYNYAPYTNLKYRFKVTNITTGVTAPDVIQVSRFITIPAAIHSYNAQYAIAVSAVVNEEIVPFAGNSIRVFSPTIPLITLNSSSCGVTLTSLSSMLTANPGLNATSYTFRIRRNDANPSPIYAYNESATRFMGVNSFVELLLEYGESYKIAVQYTFADPVTGLPANSGYGAECTVTMPPVPSISLAAPICGSAVRLALNARLATTPAPYYTGFQFRIREVGSSTYFTSPVWGTRFFSLTVFAPEFTPAYDTRYLISARYSLISGMTGWSDYGPECEITTVFFPTTSLVPSQCGLATATHLNQQLNIIPYPGFPHYNVKLDELGQGEDIVNSQEREISYSHFKLSDFSIAQLGKNYNVSVAIKLNGVFGDYSTACDLFTTGAGGDSFVKTTTETPFKVVAYPNPFADNFILDVKTSNDSNINLKVYDMVGRLIEDRDVRASEMQSATLGNQYPSGVYNVVVSQANEMSTVRVVKR